ncbi:MAG: nucleotide sugar dehydrogenase [Alphaproteobacteria bacterium]
MTTDTRNLLERIKKQDITVGVIGIGYVGLPLSYSCAKNGFHVLCFDVDESKTAKLNKGESYLDTVPSERIAPFVKSGHIKATSDLSRLDEADIVTICVPTPLDEKNEPDLTYVIKTTESIAKTLRKGQVISLESTTYPGTLDEIVAPILEKSGLKANEDFYLVYSPEREDPGNPNFETSTIPKVIGANTPDALALGVAFYEQVVSQVVPVSSARTAEAVKITENVFRAVNIALVNELKVIYQKMGIDVWEVINAAKSKPFGYMPFYPGPGLGGHCVPIDPFYLTWKAKEYGVRTRFIELAGEINTAMPAYVVENTDKALQEQNGKGLSRSNILVLGIAYKKNINDQRESPAFEVIKLLEEQGAKVDYYDPHIPEIGALREYPQLVGRKGIEWSADKLAEYDAALIITDHDTVDYKALTEHAKLVIDTRNAIAEPRTNKVIKS